MSPRSARLPASGSLGAAVDRAGAVVDQLAATAGSGLRPVVDVRRSRGHGRPATVERQFDGSLLIVITDRRVQAASDQELLGVLAHEYAHVEYDDPEPTMPRRRLLLGVTLEVGVVVVGTFASGLALAVLLGPVWFWIGLLVGAGVMVTGYAVADSFRRRRRFARTGRDSPWRELRADLRAVQLVGREPVLAMLDKQPMLGRIDQALVDIAPTHPPGSVRRAAVEQYEPAEDPGAAAGRLRDELTSDSR